MSYKKVNKIVFIWSLLIVLMKQTTSVDNQKLKVTVLYESLCPDSVRFMSQQLGPSYDILKEYIDINLVPFGKSESTVDGSTFYCQHGPSECLGNRQQSCVLHQTNNQEAQVKFVVCQMTSQDRLNVDKCTQTVGLSSNIHNCMDTELGTQLQLKAQEITYTYKPTFIPTIIYDDIFDQQLQDNSLRDFVKTICFLLHKRGDHNAYNKVCQ